MTRALMHRIGRCSVVVFLLLFLSTCAHTTQSAFHQPGQQKSMTRKDINTVLKEHEKELLAAPGVVGVYVGLLPDDKTLCLKVMVIKNTEELNQKIPKSIEGHPVVIEESGVIRPLM